MQSKAIRIRAPAQAEIDQAFGHYLFEAGPDVAGGFMDALAVAFGHIARHPATGSPRYSLQLGIPGLRSWKVTRFPFLVFYVEGSESVDVLHVLHGAMDLPEWLEH